MKIQKVDETSGQELKLNAEKSSEQRYESLRGAFHLFSAVSFQFGLPVGI